MIEAGKEYTTFLRYPFFRVLYFGLVSLPTYNNTYCMQKIDYHQGFELSASGKELIWSQHFRETTNDEVQQHLHNHSILNLTGSHTHPDPPHSRARILTRANYISSAPSFTTQSTECLSDSRLCPPARSLSLSLLVAPQKRPFRTNVPVLVGCRHSDH